MQIKITGKSYISNHEEREFNQKKTSLERKTADQTLQRENNILERKHSSETDREATQLDTTQLDKSFQQGKPTGSHRYELMYSTRQLQCPRTHAASLRLTSEGVRKKLQQLLDSRGIQLGPFKRGLAGKDVQSVEKAV